MKVGDLVITKLDNRVGCVLEIKKQPWAGLCAKVLMFDIGTTKWKKIDNIRPMLYPTELRAYYLKERNYKIYDMCGCKRNTKEANYIVNKFHPSNFVPLFFDLNQLLF